MRAKSAAHEARGRSDLNWREVIRRVVVVPRRLIGGLLVRLEVGHVFHQNVGG